VKNRLRVDGRLRQVKKAKSSDKQREQAFKQEKPKPSRLATNTTHLQNASCKKGRDDTGNVQRAPEDRKSGTELSRLVKIGRKKNCTRNESSFTGSDEGTYKTLGREEKPLYQH